MKVVVDTNIIVSGFLWRGPSHQIMDLASDRKIEIATTRLLFDELDQTLHYRKFKTRLRNAGLAVRDIKFNASQILKFIRRSTAGPSVLADPLDDELLGCAIDFQASAVVTGDKKILDVGSIQDIPIMRASQFLQKYFPPQIEQ